MACDRVVNRINISTLHEFIAYLTILKPFLTYFAAIFPPVPPQQRQFASLSAKTVTVYHLNHITA
jgi:hypothetical protein